MKRREFVKKSSISALALSLFPSLLQSCSSGEDIGLFYSGKVLIIGAGASGMMAGYTLSKYGVEYEIIEANDNYGGRVKKTDTFVNFPLDLGAEWLHDTPDALGRLINDSTNNGTVQMLSYQPESIRLYKNDKLKDIDLGSHFYREYKFKNTTWYDFFEDFIVPSIQDKLVLNEQITEIDYSNSKISVQSNSGKVYTADKVILTVPVPIVQKGMIDFNPSLPESVINRFNSIDYPPGIKVFIKFKEKFYPDICLIGSTSADKIYFDGAFKKGATDNLCTLFYVSESANELTDFTDAEIFEKVMVELDKIFDGQATVNYIDHMIQNWSNEPFILGSYSHSNTGPLENVEKKIYFAGEAFSEDLSSTVHGAGFSGVDMANLILKDG